MFTIFYFSFHILNNYQKYKNKIIFSDECHFYNVANNTYCWIRTNNFRESRWAQYSKYRFGVMDFGAIGLDFRLKIVFPKGRITSNVYLNYLKEFKIFSDADKQL